MENRSSRRLPATSAARAAVLMLLAAASGAILTGCPSNDPPDSSSAKGKTPKTCAAAAAATSSPAGALDIGKLLATRLPDLKGNIKPLGDYMGGGGLIVLFVDTTCPFSAIAIGDAPAVSKALASQKIALVLLNTDDDQEDVQRFYAKNNPKSPVVYDTTAATRDLCNVKSVPIALFITPEKKIGYQGKAVWATMATAIEVARGLPAGTINIATPGTGFG